MVMKKMKLNFLKNKWIPCNYSKTLSFRDEEDSSSQCSSSVVSEIGKVSLKMALDYALSSKRLFFKADDTSSILATARCPFKDCVALAMVSNDPYSDFWVSMEEMIKAYGLKACGLMDWDFLEELLAWYLRMNMRRNHGYIVGAFVDLCVGLTSSSCHCVSFNNASTSFSKFGEAEIDDV